jgi:hypothetical protein
MNAIGKARRIVASGLAIEVLKDRRLDRCFTRKGKLPDVSCQAHVLAAR